MYKQATGRERAKWRNWNRIAKSILILAVDDKYPLERITLYIELQMSRKMYNVPKDFNLKT